MGDQALDFFVPDQSIVRRAKTLLGTAGSATQARATVRVAPVPAAAQRRVHLATGQPEWPLTHPLFVALDLAQDVGRGREILDGGPPTIGGVVSGSRVTFVGDAMASVVRGVVEVRELIGHPPVIVGGLAVLSILSIPFRATVDLDLVDRQLGQLP